MHCVTRSISSYRPFDCGVSIKDTVIENSLREGRIVYGCLYDWASSYAGIASAIQPQVDESVKVDSMNVNIEEYACFMALCDLQSETSMLCTRVPEDLGGN